MGEPSQPAWPLADGARGVVLIDASSELEQRLIQQWVHLVRPEGVRRPITAPISPSRRRRSLAVVGRRRLRSILGDADDPYLIPVRVVWLAAQQDGRRSVRWRDLLTFGDPRDPDPMRQRYILRTEPDRCRIVVGAPARVSELRNRWRDQTDATDETAFVDFVDLQAGLALEREERALRGGRYKVPRFVAGDLLGRRNVRNGMLQLADETGRAVEDIETEVRADLDEIAATHRTNVIDLVANATRLLISKAYGDRIDYDPEHLQSIYEIA
ncbi:MAG: hypothetical protein R3246_15445, partial [Acidimicrobiia bacterium]|nr:hypothetical protein [Acidimicrobiia bacterium]